MDTENQNKYISVMYKLYTDGQDGKAELIEETAEGDPFIFVSALGMTLDAFEAQIVPSDCAFECRRGVRFYTRSRRCLWRLRRGWQAGSAS